MKINIPVTLAIVCQGISLAFIVITFILENWLVVKISNDRFGMWKVCITATSKCYNWYDNGEIVFNYKLSNFFKAFQGLQCCMLGFTFVTLISLFLNLKICAKLFIIFVIDSILMFIACSCGLASLIIFGVSVHDPDFTRLDWCYWLSLTALFFIVFSLFFLVTFTIRLRDKSYNSLKTSFFESKSNDTQLEDNQIELKENKNSPRYAPNFNKANQSPSSRNFSYNNNLNNLNNNNNNINNITSSPRFQKNQNLQNQTTNENQQNKLKRSKRNYWSNKSHQSDDKYKYKHDHFAQKNPSQEQYKAGYSSEPENIKYTLERSWVTGSNNELNNSMPNVLDSEADGLTGTFNSRHFIKLPKIIYYDGSNHYTKSKSKH